MITSRDNEKLKLVRKLHERRWRDKLGLFFVEGEDAVEAARAADAEPVELLVAGENVAADLLAEVSTAAHPPRVIAVYRKGHAPGSDARPVALSLWGVSDPGNVGTLIRSADAFGAAVVLGSGCADPTSPKALRASAGSIWRVPLLESLPVEKGHVMGSDAKVVALVAHGGEQLGSLDLKGHVVYLLGAERDGVPSDLPRDVEATIPIASESLNVATAGAIALFEWRRQNP
jgi:TrmH family RNA methyltransferase